MDAIRLHPWVTNNGILAPPPKIQPPRFISGINTIQYDNTYTILTINKQPKDYKGVPVVTASQKYHEVSRERSSYFDVGTLQQVLPEEIALWHRIHQPAKEIRYTSDYLNLFSHPFRENMEPWRIFIEVHLALVKLTSIVEGTLEFDRIPEYYLFSCVFYPKISKYMISFRVEIEKVIFRNRYHIKLKRLIGDDNIYLRLVDTFRDIFL